MFLIEDGNKLSMRSIFLQNIIRFAREKEIHVTNFLIAHFSFQNINSAYKVKRYCSYYEDNYI